MTVFGTSCVLLLCGVIAASVGVSSASVVPKTGAVTGAIMFDGGPALFGYARPSEAGTVSAFSRAGKLVASQHVRAGHSFRFRLTPGRYELIAGRALHPKLGCPPVAVSVRAGHTTHADVGTACGIQ